MEEQKVIEIQIKYFGEPQNKKARERLENIAREICALDKTIVAIGWAFTRACTLLDSGIDPRTYEIPGLIDDWLKEGE